MTELDMIMLRGMAWERAKGELRSILHLYAEQMEEYRLIEEAIENFIHYVEDEIF